MSKWWEDDEQRERDEVKEKGKTKELDLERFFAREVKKAGMRTEKWRAYDRRGVPDRVVFSNKGIILVELKTETGRVSKAQELLHRQLSEQYGIPVFILYGVRGISRWINYMLTTKGPVKYTTPAHIK